MQFYPSLPPNLLANLNLGVPAAPAAALPPGASPPPAAAPGQASDPGYWAKQPGPDFGATLAQAGLQAPSQPKPPGAGALVNLDRDDQQTDATLRALQSMTPQQRQQVQAQQAQAFQQKLGGIEAPRPAPAQPGAAGPAGTVDWTRAGGAGGQAGLPPPRNVPAHEASLVSPTAAGKSEAAGTEKRAAAEEAGQAAVGANQAQAAAFQGLSTDMDRLNAEAQSKEDARRKAFEDQAADVKRLRDEAASGKPDYGRWWRNQGVAGQVVGTIAQALGAAGASLSHTQNFAMEIINKRIDRDIAEQRDALAQKGERAKGAAEDLRIMRERFGDERAADAAMKASELEKYKLRGQAMVQQAQSPMLKAQWDGVVADIDQEQAKLYAQTHQWFQAAQVGGAGGAVSDVKPEEVMQLRDGRYVTVPTGDREKVIQAETTAQSVGAAANDARKLLSVPLTQRGPEWMSAYKAAQKTLAAAEIEGGGKGGKGMFEQFQKAQEGSWRFLTLTPGAQAAIAQVERGAGERRDAAIQQSAQYEVRPTLVQNPKTGIVQRKHIIVRPFERPRAGQAPQITPAGDEK